MLAAVCEDDRIYREGIVSICNQWKNIHKDAALVVHAYETPESLLNAHEHPLDYDLFFLDIEFGKNSMSGYRLAELIREHNKSSEIVFITNSRDYMQQGYSVSAYRYLLKPISENDVYDCLDHCMNYAFSGANLFLPFVKKDGISRIRIKDIILVESGTHSVCVRTVDGTETTHISESFETHLNNYPTEWFVRIQRGLLVNVLYVTKFTREAVYLSIGIDFQIGRRYREEVFERLQRFFIGGMK